MRLFTHSLWLGFPLIALLQVIAPTPLDAGAWTQPKGGSYFKVVGLAFRSQENLDAGGNRVAKAGRGELLDLSISGYLEYGLHQRLTLVAALPYKRLVDERQGEFPVETAIKERAHQRCPHPLHLSMAN